MRFKAHRFRPAARAGATAEFDRIALAQLLRARLDVVAVHKDVGVARLAFRSERLVGLDCAVIFARVKPQAATSHSRRVNHDRLVTNCRLARLPEGTHEHQATPS